MLTLPSMTQVISWFGWGNGAGAVAGISLILTLLVLLAPVVAGMLLYVLERAQIEAIGAVNRDFAYFFVNFVTFPGTFVHEMAHLCFGVITGAEVNEICMFEDDGERLLTSCIMAYTLDGKSQRLTDPVSLTMYPYCSKTKGVVACSTGYGEIYLINLTK